jgi:hypothetical protein
LGGDLMFSRRKILVLMIGGISIVVIGLVAYFFNGDLSDPAYANRQQLFCWLIYKDLNDQPRQTRLVLANRLEEECCKGLDWQSVSVSLDELAQDRVWNNIPLILRPWFVEKAKSYCKLPVEKRQDYLDRLIDVIAVWHGIEKLIPARIKSLNDANGSGGISKLLWKEIDQLQEESKTPENEQIGELWNALKVRWFVRSLITPSPA